MSKSTITKTFVASLVGLVGSLVLLVVAGGLAYANGNFVMDGPDVVGFRSTSSGWALILLAAVGMFTMIGAVIAQFVAWIAAVVNTAQLPDKTWFIVLLVCGLLGLGFVATLVYLIAGPPDAQPRAVPPAVAAQPLASRSTPVA